MGSSKDVSTSGVSTYFPRLKKEKKVEAFHTKERQWSCSFWTSAVLNSFRMYQLNWLHQDNCRRELYGTTLPTELIGPEGLIEAPLWSICGMKLLLKLSIRWRLHYFYLGFNFSSITNDVTPSKKELIVINDQLVYSGHYQHRKRIKLKGHNWSESPLYSYT